ncbi:hypothetical protein [Micromonospora echinofusca]|uniref:Uncharacterized protein n=1 Tax=Micromonospora echinofusca TaxID=47858 RepID=A0ABS3VLP6_MICEH|nr:hypothetical protein [Micromonospora echinofusca]MBO4205401.1 hypothetical protein [Micromonospora echinofusca]
MSRKFTRKNVLIGLAAAGVLGVGIAAPAVALADSSASPSQSASPTEDRGAAHRTEFAEALAKELGVPVEKVTEALEKVHEQRKADRDERWRDRDSNERWRDRAGNEADRQAAFAERLKQAVADGKLTQEQADAITKAAEAGVLGGGWRGHWGGPGR